MNLGTFACIVSFDLRIRTDNIRDYARLYTKYPFLALSLKREKKKHLKNKKKGKETINLRGIFTLVTLSLNNKTQ